MRKKWMDLLFRSGVVELDEEGREVVVKQKDISLVHPHEN
jgi:hypothetical protein